MSFLQIFLLVFAVIETLNMLELYFMQDKSVFNGVSIFAAWEESKQYPEIHKLMRYLANWLAGIKMIVVFILYAIIFTASDQAILAVGIMLLLAVSSFYWRMCPTLRKMDVEGQVVPRGRGNMICWMLLALEVGLAIGILVEFLM